MAKVWSSIGVPFQVQGRKKVVEKNESYYSGGGDKASESTESVQEALKKLRSSFGKKESVIKKKLKPNTLKGVGYGLMFITVIGFAYSLYYFSRTNK